MRAYLCVEIPVEEDEGLETGDGDAQIGLDAEGEIKKEDMAGPVAGDGGLGVVVHEVVCLAEGAEGQDEIDTAQKAGIIVDRREIRGKVVAALVLGGLLALDGLGIGDGGAAADEAVEGAETGDKLATDENGAGKFEIAKVNIDNLQGAGLVVGKPYLDGGLGGGAGLCAAHNRGVLPVARIEHRGRMAVGELAGNVALDGEVLAGLGGRLGGQILCNHAGDAKRVAEAAGGAEVEVVRVRALDVVDEAGCGKRRVGLGAKKGGRGGPLDAGVVEVAVDGVERESADEAGEQGAALGELRLEVLEVAARLQRLAVAVLLFALDAGRLACAAVGVFRVALRLSAQSTRAAGLP